MFTNDEAHRRLDAAVRAMTAASAQALRQIPTIEDEGSWEAGGASCMTQWLAWRYELVWSTALEWVRVARRLRELPCIANAHEEGHLSWDQLRPLTKFATPATDERLAREAVGWRPAGLWREAARHERLRERDATETHRERYVRFGWNQEKTECYVQGRFGAEQGVLLERAVMKRSEQVEVSDDPYDPHGAVYADALVELVTQTRSGRASDPLLVLHADVSSLVGGHTGYWRPSVAEGGDGVRLCIEAIRRIACDPRTRIEWMLERDGLGVGIGFQSERIPKRLERAVRERDGWCCRFPGCRKRRWLKSHHLKHWPLGPTDLDNLVTLCEAHHRLVHEGGWSIRGTPNSGLRFHDPGGRPLMSMPEQLALDRAIA
ncbi:MAG: DUF222 domain-containing protein [Actinomycetota bacterium]